MKIFHLIIGGLLLLLLGCGVPAPLSNQSVRPADLPAIGRTDFDPNKTDTLLWSEIANDAILNAYIDSAIQNNFNIKMAYQKLEQLRQVRVQTKGALLPQVNLGAAGSLRKFGLYTMDGAGNIVTEIIPGKLVPIDLPDIYTGIQASWEADIRGKLKNLDRAALTRFLAGTDGIQFVVSGIISDVIVSYYQLITKDNELRVIRESAEKEKEALDFIRAQKDAGKTNELVVQQFTAQYYNLKVLEREVMQEIVKEENRFNLLLGRYPQQVKRNSETLYYQDNIWKGKVNSGVLLNRPDIRAAEKNIAAARLDVMAARASFYPSFNINLNAGLQSFGFNYFFVAPESIMYQLAGNLLSPLINKSSLRAQYGYTKAAHADAILQYRQSLLTAFMEVSGDISELRHLENIKQLSESKLNEYQKAVESSFDLYKAARVSYLDVLISQQNALQANLELIRIYQRSRVTQVKLFRNLGGRWG